MSTVLPVWTLVTWVILMILVSKVLYLEKAARDLRKRTGVESPGDQAKSWLERHFGRKDSKRAKQR